MSKPQMAVKFVSVLAPAPWKMTVEGQTREGTTHRANVVQADNGEVLTVKLSEEVWRAVSGFKFGQDVLLTFDIRAIQRQLIAVVVGVEAVQHAKAG